MRQAAESLSAFLLNGESTMYTLTGRVRIPRKGRRMGEVVV